MYLSIHPSIHRTIHPSSSFIYHSTNQSINPIMSSPYLFIHVKISIYPPVVYPSIHPSIHGSIHLSTYLSLHLSIYLSAHLSTRTYVYTHVCAFAKKCCIHTILAHYQLNLYFVFLVIIMHSVRVSYARRVPLHGLKVRTSQSALLVLCGGPPKSGRFWGSLTGTGCSMDFYWKLLE